MADHKFPCPFGVGVQYHIAELHVLGGRDHVCAGQLVPGRKGSTASPGAGDGAAQGDGSDPTAQAVVEKISVVASPFLDGLEDKWVMQTKRPASCRSSGRCCIGNAEYVSCVPSRPWS